MEDQPVQNSVPEPVSAPDQIPQEKPKFPVMYLVLSVFILLFLASTAFLYYQNMQLKNMLANYQTPVVSPTSTATADPTANWKTYTNDQFNISFMVPTSFIEGKGSGVNYYWSYPVSDTPLGLGENGVWMSMKQAVWMNEKTGPTDLLKLGIGDSITYDKSGPTEAIYTKIENINSNPLLGSLFSIEPTKNNYQPIYSLMYIPQEPGTVDGKLFSFYLSAKLEKNIESHRDEFVKILSTFKFTQ